MGLHPDRLGYSTQWRVRVYELDANGHVNNAVYLNYAEQVAVEHAEAAGFGRDWTLARGGTWFVHRQEIVYRRPAVYGDELEVTTRITEVKGARGGRRTTIARARDRVIVAEIATQWVWVRLTDGRPSRVPAEVVDMMLGNREPAEVRAPSDAADDMLP